jgi:hypothetical protein
MIEHLASLKTILETAGKFKKAFENLRSSSIFLNETDLFDLIEKYFSLEPLPKGKIKLTGRISNYTLNNSFPIYTPAHLKGIKQSSVNKFIQEEKEFKNVYQIDLKAKALNVPSITYKPISLTDGSKAKILWLYPANSEGLVFNPVENQGLVRDNLCQIFGIENKDKPIPILVNLDFPNYYLYKTVTITGLIYSSPIELFNQFSLETDSFILDYFSNCFRPLSSQDGVLAIDARTPLGRIEKIHDNKNPFKIIYTVQGSIELPDQFYEAQKIDLIMNECIDAIPDRQGLGSVRSFGDSLNVSDSIVSIGETLWQKDKKDSGIAAFKEIDLNDHSYNQANLTELANNWQVWQKTARERIRKRFGIEPKIRPIICSNSTHEKTFHPNGLQISKSVEEKLLNSNPQIRKSIDWLGISTGKS